VLGAEPCVRFFRRRSNRFSATLGVSLRAGALGAQRFGHAMTLFQSNTVLKSGRSLYLAGTVWRCVATGSRGSREIGTMMPKFRAATMQNPGLWKPKENGLAHTGASGDVIMPPPRSIWLGIGKAGWNLEGLKNCSRISWPLRINTTTYPNSATIAKYARPRAAMICTCVHLLDANAFVDINSLIRVS
jgi:hypothetical protein